MFRSGFEETIANQLTSLGIRWQFEEWEIEYYQKVPTASCADCGSKNVKKKRTYLTDFYLPDYDFFIEVKGRWTSADRTKHLAIKEDCSEEDIRFVFMYDNWLTKKKKAKYSDWCTRNGFRYSIKEVDLSWIK